MPRNPFVPLHRHCLRPFIGLMLLALLVAGCSTATTGILSQAQTADIEQHWGVEPVALRLIGSDHFIDFRYRVIDAEKAATLLQRKNKPYLIDEATGRVHTVPVTKLGPMRASANQPKANKNYVVLFGNPDKQIRKGSVVTVVIGDFRAEHMTVM